MFGLIGFIGVIFYLIVFVVYRLLDKLFWRGTWLENGVTLSKVALSIAIVLVVFGWIWLINSYYPKKKFSKTTWEAKPRERYQYKDDLLKNYNLTGKQRWEVIAFLDLPDGYFDGYDVMRSRLVLQFRCGTRPPVSLWFLLVFTVGGTF